jgi:hypothetical protein
VTVYHIVYTFDKSSKHLRAAIFASHQSAYDALPSVAPDGLLMFIGKPCADVQDQVEAVAAGWMAGSVTTRRYN